MLYAVANWQLTALHDNSAFLQRHRNARSECNSYSCWLIQCLHLAGTNYNLLINISTLLLAAPSTQQFWQQTAHSSEELQGVVTKAKKLVQLSVYCCWCFISLHIQLYNHRSVITSSLAGSQIQHIKIPFLLCLSHCMFNFCSAPSTLVQVFCSYKFYKLLVFFSSYNSSVTQVVTTLGLILLRSELG